MAGGVSVFGDMKALFFTLIFVCFGLTSAHAQDAPETLPDITPDELPVQPEEDSQPDPDEEGENEIIEEKSDEPDYSHLTPKAEREARLNDLFERLKAETNPELANLVAEEIWAIWLDSGSPSVNLILRRGTAAEKRADIDLARRMYDHVTTLSPDYAEGWARSARLAYSEDNLNRALSEVVQALVLEPRHFYALWTLGNVMEKLGRTEEALEAYQEAHDLYPELEAVKNRVTLLEGQVNGQAL